MFAKKILKWLYNDFLGDWSKKIGTCVGIFFAVPFAFHPFSVIGGFAWFLLGMVVSVALIVFVQHKKDKAND